LSEAIFANKVLLVEGTTDRAIFEAIINRQAGHKFSDFAVAEVGGKANLIGTAKLLRKLGISVSIVFDNDRIPNEDEVPKEYRSKFVQMQSKTDSVSLTRKICSDFSVSEVDYPKGEIAADLFAIDVNLEFQLCVCWEGWKNFLENFGTTCISSHGKNELLYRMAAETIENNPPDALQVIVSKFLNS
jgi:hypothetical protein